MNTFATFPEELRKAESAVACFFCWPRLSLTCTYDHKGRPICAACANNPYRRQQMPRFVVRLEE